MKVAFDKNGKIISFEMQRRAIPFAGPYGFFMGEHTIPLQQTDHGYEGSYKDVRFLLKYVVRSSHLELHMEICNHGAQDETQDIGFHMGIDSYMESYPQWHTPLFPTLLRCEKTHLWGYYMNTAENALAVASDREVASYNINYNQIDEDNGGHRITGTDILFFTNCPLPQRHPQNVSVLKAGQVYKNILYLIPVEQKKDILPQISKIADLPMIHATKYTYEKGERLDYTVYSKCKYKTTLILPDGREREADGYVFEDFGVYKLKVHAENGKIGEAMFCCRKDWDFYLYHAAQQALEKPQKATTHVESFYGLFSLFLSGKYFKDPALVQKAYACFEEIMPLMFDFAKGVPIVIPRRIQNTALLISLLTDMYEMDPEKNLKYLGYASKFADWLMTKQDDQGVYRKRNTHYTCVIYIAKAMLELALAEKNCADREIREKYEEHYRSAGRAVDELVLHLDNIDTEGELTLEDGMLSCAALQMGMYALTLPPQQRKKYITAAQYMMKIHACLEQQLIPDCRMNGGSLRYWESQYDVMIRANMLNSPHGWTAWTAYAHYYLYMLTGKKEHLVRLMNTLGSCAQLMDFDGQLRWAFCAQPYVKAKTLVPDTDQEVEDGYAFVEAKQPAYRGKYEQRELGEEYVDMISGWYRVGAQKLVGGYEFCPLSLQDEKVLNVDNQGGCCDNDVHEIFKCIEECVFRKAFIYENEDGSFLSYGCTVKGQDGKLEITPNENVTQIIYNLGKSHKNNITEQEIQGFGIWTKEDNKAI